MMFIHVAVAVLSLLSVGQSAPVSHCESLIQPIAINGREQLLGQWTYIAESTNIPSSRMLTKMFVETARSKITAANESDAIIVLQSQKVFGRCFTLTSKMTLENNTLSSVHPFPGSEILLSTGCPDCLVFYSNYSIGGQTYSALQLLSRRTKVVAAELEEFKKQVECLNLPAAAILDPEKGFCLDDSPSQETGTIDLTNIVKDMDSEVFSLINRLISSEGGIQTLLEMISSSISGLKEI